MTAATGRERVLAAIRETGLCLITDDRLEFDALLAATREALLGGVRLVQYRDKLAMRRTFLERARRVQALCAEFDAAFVVNDHTDVAAVLGADGLHLGQDDLPPEDARRIVGADIGIGLSISYAQEARDAAAAGVVDYIGCGAVFPTATKPDAEYGGLELLREVRGILGVPILGIGGINAENLAEPLHAGADGVALVSAVYGAERPSDAARNVLASVRAARTSAEIGPTRD